MLYLVFLGLKWVHFPYLKTKLSPMGQAKRRKYQSCNMLQKYTRRKNQYQNEGAFLDPSLFGEK